MTKTRTEKTYSVTLLGALTESQGMLESSCVQFCNHFSSFKAWFGSLNTGIYYSNGSREPYVIYDVQSEIFSTQVSPHHITFTDAPKPGKGAQGKGVVMEVQFLVLTDGVRAEHWRPCRRLCGVSLAECTVTDLIELSKQSKDLIWVEAAKLLHMYGITA